MSNKPGSGPKAPEPPAAGSGWPHGTDPADRRPPAYDLGALAFLLGHLSAVTAPDSQPGDPTG